LRAFLTGLCLALALPAAAMAQQTSPVLSKLHDELRLTPDQEGPWRQYAMALDDQGQMQARRKAAELLLPQLQTPRRLALMQATMADELGDFNRQSLAIDAFYGRLTPDQQRTFDRDTLPSQGAPAR
jgi:periplasmic protein CpxP/Spy